MLILDGEVVGRLVLDEGDVLREVGVWEDVQGLTTACLHVMSLQHLSTACICTLVLLSISLIPSSICVSIVIFSLFQAAPLF